MVGKLYTKRSLVYVHFCIYGLLALAGGIFLGAAFSRGEKPSGVLGFVIVFGLAWLS